MSENKSKAERVHILQDITFKAKNNSNSNTELREERNVCDASLIDNRDGLVEENRFNADYTIVDVENTSRIRRYTSSMYVFEEEPVFSDSEEEKEYPNRIFESQGFQNNHSPEKTNREAECNLTSVELKVTEIIKTCANINIEDVNEDFRKLILLCKELECKYNYETPPMSIKENISSRSDEVQSFQQQPETVSRVEDIGLSSTSKEFLPSRSGNGIDGFISENYTFDSGIFDITNIIETSSQDGRRNQGRRRSTRFQKPAKRKTENVDVIDKNKNKPIKTRRRQKRSTEFSSNPENVKLKNEDDVNGRINTASAENDDKKRVERRKKHEEGNIVLKPNLRKKSYEENSAELPSKDRAEKFDCTPVRIPILKGQARTLARSWMKPKKSIMKHYQWSVPSAKTAVSSFHHRNRARHLYSPNEWLHSKDFNNLIRP